MATISVPQSLADQVENLARAQDRTATELLTEVLDRYFDEQEWRGLQAYGWERARALGYTEDDVERLIEESRREHGL